MKNKKTVFFLPYFGPYRLCFWAERETPNDVLCYLGRVSRRVQLGEDIWDGPTDIWFGMLWDYAFIWNHPQSDNYWLKLVGINTSTLHACSCFGNGGETEATHTPSQN